MITGSRQNLANHLMRMSSSPNKLTAGRELSRALGLVLVLLSLGFVGGSLAAEVRFSASLDRESVVRGETVTLTLKFEGGSPKALPAIPPIAGLQVGQNVSSSINTTMAPGGAMTSIHSYSLSLVPHQAGEFVIPALQAEVGGQMLQSQPLRLKVQASDPTAPPPEFAEKLAFLWLVLPKNEIFVGEVLVAELRVYLRGDVANFSDAQIPPLGSEGFTSGKFVEGQRFQRQVGNAPFLIIPLRVALTPVKSGSLSLGPMKGSLVAHLPSNQPRRRDIFSFFEPNTQPHKVELTLDAAGDQCVAAALRKCSGRFRGSGWHLYHGVQRWSDQCRGG